jgi:hypothetical protein
MAPWQGHEAPDEAALVDAALSDLQDLQRALRATRASVGQLLAARPRWLASEVRSILTSIQNACNVLVGPAGRVIRVLEKQSKSHN